MLGVEKRKEKYLIQDWGNQVAFWKTVIKMKQKREGVLRKEIEQNQKIKIFKTNNLNIVVKDRTMKAVMKLKKE